MKKYFLSIVALAAMLFATSCQESLVEPQVDGTTTFTIEVPGQMGTKAVGKTYNLYVEVYDENGGQCLDRITGEQIISGKTTTVRLNLVATQKYDIIFWAQKSDDTHNVSADHDLRNVGIKYYHNSEDGEAYYAIMNDFEPIKAKNPSVSLTRPFAQLNIATLDEVDYEKAGNNKMKITRAEIFISQVAKTFERKTSSDTYGVGDSPAIYNPSVDGIYSNEKFVVNGVEYTHISMDYLAVVDNDALVDVTVKLDVKDPYDVPSHIERTITNVPLKLNHKTNIVGNLITSASDFTVSIDEDWLGENNEVKEFVGVEVSNEAEFWAAINDSSVDGVTLTNDIDLGDQTLTFNVPTTRASESVQRSGFIFDGNGKTLTYNGNARAIDVTKDLEGFNLTLKNLNIELASTYAERGVNYNTNGKLVLENVTIADSDHYFTYAINLPTSSKEAEVEIKNSNISSNIALNVWGESVNVSVENSTLISIDKNQSENYVTVSLNSTAEKSIISITGGKVIAYDQNGDLSSAFINNAPFGVISVSESTEVIGNNYEPVASVSYSNSDNSYLCTTLSEAIGLAKGGSTITLLSDIEQADGVLITDKNITIDLNGKTYTVTEGASTNNRNFKINGSSIVTIKNGIMIAAGNYSSGAYGTLRTEGAANVTLNGVKLYNYRGNGLNVKALSGTTVTIIDTEIYSVYGGGVESAGGTVELTNVKVEQKGMYTAPYNSMAISVNGGGQVTVHSGTYSTECITAEEANNQGLSHGPWCAGVLNSGGTLIIKGGTFSNDNFGDNSLATYARGLLLADTGANIQIEDGTFNAVKAIIDIQNNLGDASKQPNALLKGGEYSADPRKSASYASELIKVAEGYGVLSNANGTYTVIPTTLKDGAVLDWQGAECDGTIIVEGNVTIKGDTKITTLKSTTGCTITIEDGKTLTLKNFSFGAKDNASAEYEIKGGKVVADYGFFQHGKYALHSNFETGYMYYSYGSDITVYGTFHSQGKGDGLDYVRGNLTIAKGGKSIHEKSLWVGQPASWGEMNATLTIEPGGYVQVNSLSVYKGSTLTYSNDEDLKYNSIEINKD